ncbi:MAG: hypothetical protein ACI4WY_11550 [Anaerovoracaceae bacterium]
MKKFFAVLMIAVMITCFMPTMAFASTAPAPTDVAVAQDFGP